MLFFLTFLLYVKDENIGGRLIKSSIFAWKSKVSINKLMHILNGNRESRGKGIVCSYWNKGSSYLKNKQDDIKQLIQDHRPHILGLGEANFKKDHKEDDVTIQGYKLNVDSAIDISSLDNTARVVIYTHDSVRVTRRPDLELENIAAVWLEAGLPGQKSIIIFMAYRQWRLLGQPDDRSASVCEQLARWTLFLHKWELALLEGKEVVVMMDANLDHLTWGCTENLPSYHSSIRLKDLIELLFEKIMPLGVSQMVTCATRYERGQPISGLDHIYTNKPEKLSPVRTYFSGMSDHKLLTVTRYTKSFVQLPRYVKKRVFKNFNKNEFVRLLSESNVDEVLTCSDANYAVNLLTNKINYILDILAPIRTIQTRANYVPGLSTETKQLQKQRNSAQKRAALTGNPEDWRIFRSLRNRATASVRKDKARWERNKFSDVDHSSTDIWRTVKTWLGWNSGGTPSQLFFEGRLITRPSGLSTCMNEFFIGKIKNLRQKIPPIACDPLMYLRQAMVNRSCSFHLKLVSIPEVKKVINNLKNSSATGVDYIDTRTIKLGLEVLAPAMQHIINLSISTSTFPDAWKWHKVVPLLKGAGCEKISPNNYRPVALLPVLSKVLEKVVFGQLVEYLENNALIHPNLHGSRAGHSTATALTQLYDNWVEEVERGNMVGVLLCDQSAAFDLCDHHLLLEKLKLMGLEATATAWFMSYLSNRKQSCMVDGHMSDPLPIPQCGVPQGSIGGPILWLIFTCDQPDVVHNHPVDINRFDRGCSFSSSMQLSEESRDTINENGHGCGLFVGYVDDGAFSYASSNPAVLSTIMTYKYDKMSDWMKANRLVINPDKTHLMVMAKRCQKAKRNEVTMIAGTHLIKPSETEKLLGGLFHQSLNWKVHIRDHKCSLLNQLIGRMNGLRKICRNASFKTRLMIANGVIMSKLTYLINLWGGAPQYLLNVLQIQQLVAARLVCSGDCSRWSKRKLLTTVGWLSVKQLIFYHTVLQAHKTLSSGLPRPLFYNLSTEYPRLTRSATAGQIRQTTNNSSSATFSYRAMINYNSVPVDIRSGSTNSVKCKLKKWIRTNIPID